MVEPERAPSSSIPQQTLERCAAAFRMLAHPDRLRIVEALEPGERTVQEIAASIGLPQPATSQHLNQMKSRGLLGSRRRGRRVAYFIVDPSATVILNCVRDHACGA